MIPRVQAATPTTDVPSSWRSLFQHSAVHIAHLLLMVKAHFDEGLLVPVITLPGAPNE